MGLIITDSFMEQPSSGPAFVQMTSQLFEEVVRNTKRLPEMEALDIATKLIWGQNDPYLSTDVAEDFRSPPKTSSPPVLPPSHWPQLDTPDHVSNRMLTS